MEEQSENELYSKRVRAGKRTYFFDVKSTRANDYYLTITESKRRIKEDGFVYEKHKIFLYKEDFGKFAEALLEALDHVKHELMPDVDFTQFDRDDYMADGSENGTEARTRPPVHVAETATVAEDAPMTQGATVTETDAPDDSTELKWD